MRGSIPGCALNRRLWHRLRRHPGALIAGAVLLLLALSSLIVPALSPYDYYTPQLDLISQPPTLRGGHLLGTDPLGRDLARGAAVEQPDRARIVSVRLLHAAARSDLAAADAARRPPARH